MAMGTNHDQLSALLLSFVQDLFHARPLNVERHYFHASFTESLLQAFKLPVRGPDLVRHVDSHRLRTGFKPNKVRLGFLHMQEDDASAECSRHRPGCINHALGDIGEINRHKNRFRIHKKPG